MKNVLLLGACGNLGFQTIEVLEKHKDKFYVYAASLSRNDLKNYKLLRKINPKVCVLQKESNILKYQKKYPKIKFLIGEEALNNICFDENINVVINCLSGLSGVIPSYNSLINGKELLLANKESMVIAGYILSDLAYDKGIKIIPIDSEHNAIFNLLKNEKVDVSKVIITASGGPFRDLSYEELKKVTKEQALNHPTWKMGPKITIDSATLMNKTFEIIEAATLFYFNPEVIEVIINYESKVHSMVYFNDNRLKYFTSKNNMKKPIENSLLYPLEYNYNTNESLSNLRFKFIDTDRFRNIFYAYDILENFKYNYLGAILVGVNDSVVNLFLNDKIIFYDIDNMIEEYYGFYRDKLIKKYGEKQLNIYELVDLSKEIYKSIVNINK